MDGLLILESQFTVTDERKHHPILCMDRNKSSIFEMKEIMKLPSQTHPTNSRHPENQKNNKSLMQAIEEVLRKNGLEPKWDYSKAGQSAIMPARKKHSGK